MILTDEITKAPDVGVGEEVAHLYFGELLSGLVTLRVPLSVCSARRLLTSTPETLLRSMFIQRASVIGISSPKTFFLMPQELSRYPILVFARFTS